MLLVKNLDNLTAAELRDKPITRSPDAKVLSVLGDACDLVCSSLALNVVFRVNTPDFSSTNPANSAPKITLISDVDRTGSSSAGTVNPCARKGASSTARKKSRLYMIVLHKLIRLVY